MGLSSPWAYPLTAHYWLLTNLTRCSMAFNEEPMTKRSDDWHQASKCSVAHDQSIYLSHLSRFIRHTPSSYRSHSSLHWIGLSRTTKTLQAWLSDVQPSSHCKVLVTNNTVQLQCSLSLWGCSVARPLVVSLHCFELPDWYLFRETPGLSLHNSNYMASPAPCLIVDWLIDFTTFVILIFQLKACIW